MEFYVEEQILVSLYFVDKNLHNTCNHDYLWLEKKIINKINILESNMYKLRNC